MRREASCTLQLLPSFSWQEKAALKICLKPRFIRVMHSGIDLFQWPKIILASEMNEFSCTTHLAPKHIQTCQVFFLWQNAPLLNVLVLGFLFLPLNTMCAWTQANTEAFRGKRPLKPLFLTPSVHEALKWRFRFSNAHW